jgi:hypothetical protein
MASARRADTQGARGTLWYVGAAVDGGLANPRAYAAFAAVLLASCAAGCGGGERRDAHAGGGDDVYRVDIVRARFPLRQHLGDKPAFVMTVRNTGTRAIPNLAVTLRGFFTRGGGSAQADNRELVWLVDDEPINSVTAIQDTWTAGELRPGATRTMRWQVTPVLAGVHRLFYTVAPDLVGSGRIRAAGGVRPSGVLTVGVDPAPPYTRVNPRTGEVQTVSNRLRTG